MRYSHSRRRRHGECFAESSIVSQVRPSPHRDGRSDRQPRESAARVASPFAAASEAAFTSVPANAQNERTPPAESGRC